MLASVGLAPARLVEGADGKPSPRHRGLFIAIKRPQISHPLHESIRKCASRLRLRRGRLRLGSMLVRRAKHLRENDATGTIDPGKGSMRLRDVASAFYDLSVCVRFGNNACERLDLLGGRRVGASGC